MSLRLRLALWYGGLTGLLVLLVCAYSYAVHSRAHYDEIDAALASSAEHVAVELSAVSTPAARAGVLHASVLLGSAMRIYGADGVLRLQTESGASAPAVDLRELLAGGAPPPYPAVARLAPPLHVARRPHGAFGLVPGSPRWRLHVLPLAAGAEYLVAVAPLDMIDRSVGRFAQIMVVMAAVGTALTFLVGWLLAAHALRPVALLTATAGAIARSGEFSRRVPADAAAATGDELGRLAATFNEMLGSLEQAYLIQKRFVSDASHELRAPLTAIQANLELLRDRADMPAVERELATREAAREADRLARLVADLLALARADAGMPLRRESVELDRLLMDVVGEARFLMRGQKLEIGTLDPCAMEGDPDRLKQLLLIFVDNAIKYTPSDGQVRLSLRREGDTAAFTVEDTGVGIPPSALPRVFERFYRADGARSRDPGGTGLGLSIARWIAAQHGGSVHLESKMGRGTTATAILPLRP
ncbi:MAG: HAMP domain-containing histidine kinase [Gemmatimonadaceae bacterium]|nr:HAMP domain-containing histidine kinase [Gemmatimonadaceae bacterium]